VAGALHGGACSEAATVHGKLAAIDATTISIPVRVDACRLHKSCFAIIVLNSPPGAIVFFSHKRMGLAAAAKVRVPCGLTIPQPFTGTFEFPITTKRTVKFWDAPAIVSLLVEEPRRERMLSILEDDPVMLVWWGTPVGGHRAAGTRRIPGGSRPGTRARPAGSEWRPPAVHSQVPAAIESRICRI
jgi:hypothetical protein